MKVVSNIEALNHELGEVRKSGLSIGLVPTMGALHTGHKSLVEKSVAENDFTVVSVFVNPTQFNNTTDLEKYPRNLQRDADLLETVGCNLVFAPEAKDVYSEKEMTNRFEFDFEGLDKVMEGRFRPGHFNGVVQIVSKLFTLVGPDRAYFGEKDFQQLAIIHLMVRKMGFKLQIVDCPIVRETTGLALSSRNERLSRDQLKIAEQISHILTQSRHFAGKIEPKTLEEWVQVEVNAFEGLEVEYFEIVNINTLQPIKSWKEPSVGCIAVYCGEVRLIDNIKY
ncbi:MAG: pantoate--beta-alanine ligase [Paludibacter sp.]|nr:pantoate--beta-alanine ligase [Paludibacter sp.]